MADRTFLVTYRPLCSTEAGLRAIERFQLPAFVDGSCRREPDFEAQWPTVTALCRGANFAPRLERGDEVVYITAKLHEEWRLTAILDVIERFESHDAAAQWFRDQNLPLPSNCMVKDNPPVPLNRTSGIKHLHAWDADYRRRARRYGVVLACKPVYLNLHDPPRITRDDWYRWNDGRIPATRTPADQPHLREHLWRVARIPSL